MAEKSKTTEAKKESKESAKQEAVAEAVDPKEMEQEKKAAKETSSKKEMEEKPAQEDKGEEETANQGDKKEEPKPAEGEEMPAEGETKSVEDGAKTEQNAEADQKKDDQPVGASGDAEEKKETSNAARNEGEDKGAEEKKSETAAAKPKVEDKDESDKKRRFKLPFLSKKKKEKPSEDEAEEKKPSKPLTADQVINALDPENKIDSDTAKALAMKLDEQITEVADKDTVTLKVKKKLLLLAVGLLILAMWIVPLMRGIQPLYDKYLKPADTGESMAESGDENSRVKVRVKYAVGEMEAGETLAVKLRESGNFDLVEVVEDGELDDTGIGVVSKTDEGELRNEVVELLQGDYEVASPSAVLSEDSDFDVVVFVKLNE